MRLWIDCEFNESGGDLISLAIVPEGPHSEYWYEVLPCANPKEWVSAHVMPVLGRSAISLAEFQDRLEEYLMGFGSVHVIADWPEDIAYFCKALITEPGCRIKTPPLTMEIRRDINSNKSEIPHNALSDAFAIKRMHEERE